MQSLTGYKGWLSDLTGPRKSHLDIAPLTRHWPTLDLSDDDFTDAQAIAAIARITSGNFRLLQRLFTRSAAS